MPKDKGLMFYSSQYASKCVQAMRIYDLMTPLMKRSISHRHDSLVFRQRVHQMRCLVWALSMIPVVGYVSVGQLKKETANHPRPVVPIPKRTSDLISTWANGFVLWLGLKTNTRCKSIVGDAPRCVRRISIIFFSPKRKKIKIL